MCSHQFHCRLYSLNHLMGCRKGRVADSSVDDNATSAIRKFNDSLLRDERVSLAFVPIGDGMALCTKR